MTTVDFNEWIGRQDTCDDAIDLGHVMKVGLSIDQAAPGPGDILPPLWHWCFFVNAFPYDQLGRDGHPTRNGFLPPAGDLNRMWAGGRVQFMHPLRVGVPARRQSTLKHIVEKQGKTGKLLFLTVQHDYTQDAVLCVSEEQDIVYREPTPPKLQGTTPAPQAQWSTTVSPSAVMLFRYSAVTFNGHRIHYDYPYVTQVEGYPGLVVHGPMIATLMCQAFTQAHLDKRITSFNYRGVRPLVAPAPFQAAGTLTGENTASVWAEQDGTLAHQGELTFERKA